MSWLIAHSSIVLMVLLTASEVLGAIMPAGAGGIVPGIISALKAVGAKDVDGQ